MDNFRIEVVCTDSHDNKSQELITSVATVYLPRLAYASCYHPQKNSSRFATAEKKPNKRQKWSWDNLKKNANNHGNK